MLERIRGSISKRVDNTLSSAFIAYQGSVWASVCLQPRSMNMVMLRRVA